ncbi:MAG: GNAT family N-acetyltransferase, partial [Acidobacteriia bacterium]|nr:GNAT family N-acetyltransferase [Terriglobia bacterium]
SYDFLIRPATDADASSIAAIHRETFPRSGLSALGQRALTDYYRWQMQTTPELDSAAAEHSGRVVGYCLAGGSFGSLADFLRSHGSIVARETLRHPAVLIDARLLRIFPYLTRRIRKQFRPARDKIRSAQLGAHSYGIQAIAVAAEAQRRGVARALMAWAEAEGLRRGIRYMYLAVDTANQPAISFYEYLGWQRVKKGDYWNGHMKKDLLAGPQKPIEAASSR